MEDAIEILRKHYQEMEIPPPDRYNIKLLWRLNKLIDRDSKDGIDNIDGYEIYIKDGQVIAAVNVENIEEYGIDPHYVSSHVNVLFRKLGSDKTVKRGWASAFLHDDDVYLISDNPEDYKTCYKGFKK
jgi:hypothetical protein